MVPYLISVYYSFFYSHGCATQQQQQQNKQTIFRKYNDPLYHWSLLPDLKEC